MRLLHAGNGDGRGLADRGGRRHERGGDPGGPRGEPLSLHRLPQHRRGRAGRRGEDGGGVVMSAGIATAKPDAGGVRPSGMCPAGGGDQAAGFRSCGILLREQGTGAAS